MATRTPAKLTSALFGTSLPLVFIEKVKILETDFTTQKQEVEVTLSVQKQPRSRMLPYRIFVGLATTEEQISRMMRRDSAAKDMIRNSARDDGIRKVYLKQYVRPDGFDEKGSASGNMKIVKKSLTFVEEFDVSELRDLHIYATAYAINPQSLIKSGVDTNIKAMRISAPTIETIMVNGATSNTGVVYTLMDSVKGYGNKGSIWSGPIHEFKGILMAGKQHSTVAHPRVEKTVVSSQKILDMRFLNWANRLPFNNSDPQSSSQLERKHAATIKKIASPPSPISDAQYSRTSSGALKILFSVDHMQLVMQNTKLGNLILNQDALVSTLQIEDVQVYRTRTTPSATPNALTPGKINICGGNSTLSTGKLIASLKKSGVKAVDLGAEDTNILNFVITDDNISNDDMGTYQYKIYIDMIDQSTSAAAELSRRLTIGLSRYDSYIMSIEARSRKGTSKGSGKALKAYMKANKRNIKASNNTWRTLIDDYMTAVKFVFGSAPFVEYTSLTWKKTLFAMANPDNGSMKNIKQVAEIIEDFNTNLQRMYKGTTSQGSSASFKVSSKAGSQGAPKRKTILEHVFTTRYKKDSTPLDGTDYLDVTAVRDNADNFTNLSFGKFNKRINDEVKKYSTPLINTENVNKFGYLSPRRLLGKGVIIDTNSTSIPQSKGNGILAAAKNPATTGLQPIASNKSDKIFSMQIDSLLNLADVSAVPLRQPLVNLMNKTAASMKETVDSTFYLSTNNEFNKNILDAKAAASGSQEGDIDKNRSTSRVMDMKKSRLVQSIINSSAINFKRKPPVKIEPSATPSLAAQSLASKSKYAAKDAKVVAPQSENNLEMTMNYNSSTEIQYYAGHRVTGEVTNLNDKVWKTMTEQQFKQMKNSGKQVLCRTVELNNAVVAPNNYKLPEYDSLFVLGNKPAATKNVNSSTYTSVIANIAKKSKNENKNVSLNIESAAANVENTYTSLPVQVKAKPLPAPRRVTARPPSRSSRATKASPAKTSSKKGGGY